MRIDEEYKKTHRFGFGLPQPCHLSASPELSGAIDDIISADYSPRLHYEMFEREDAWRMVLIINQMKSNVDNAVYGCGWEYQDNRQDRLLDSNITM